ncbi:MAG: response regulator transcription factor [Armatimonadetes bacterium]|nr:response regulator transcription factor [Armatimonadota bacterium]
MARAKILVVDDEVKITKVVSAYLEKEGYRVLVSDSGEKAVSMVWKEKPDLVILDLMLPDCSGEEVCRTLRKETDMPILMLTAKAAEEDRVTGLAIGADDYLVKPFSPRELVGRVRAILRRTRQEVDALVDRMSFDGGRLTIDARRQIVLGEGSEIPLTANEYKILVLLARHPGRVYSRSDIIEKVWGYDYEGEERTIDAHIKNLRRKLDLVLSGNSFIRTIYGMGYKFEET